MKKDIKNGNYVKGVMIRKMSNFRNYFCASYNANIFKFISWWKKRNKISSDTDFDFVYHRLPEKNEQEMNPELNLAEEK